MRDHTLRQQDVLQPIRDRIDATGLSSARAKIALESVIKGVGVIRHGMQP